MGIKRFLSKSSKLMAVLSTVTFLIFSQTLPSSAAQGELVLEEISNGLPAYGNCGTMYIKFYNASTKPIINARLLYVTDTSFPGGGKKKLVPFRGGKEKNSWITYKMFLAPGKSQKFKRTLCSNVSIQNMEDEWEKWGRIFNVKKYDWTWAR